MRRYLLDTTPLTAYLFGRSTAVNLINPWIVNDEVATSILPYAEVVEYLRSQPEFPTRHQALRELLSGIYPYSLTYPILDRYSVIRRQLRSPYGPGLIGDVDTLIAATAPERNLTVVTSDRDYERVPGLTILALSPDDLRRR